MDFIAAYMPLRRPDIPFDHVTGNTNNNAWVNPFLIY